MLTCSQVRWLVLPCLVLAGGGCRAKTRELDAKANLVRAWPLPQERIAVCTKTDFQIWSIHGRPTLVRSFGLPPKADWRLVEPVSETRAAFILGERGDRKMVGLWEWATGDSRQAPIENADANRVALAASASSGLIAWCVSDRRDATFTIRVVGGPSLMPVAEASQSLISQSQTVEAMRFSPDGGLLAFGGSGGELSLGVLDVRRKTILWYRNADGPWDMAFSPDGSHLFTSSHGGGLTCYDALSGGHIWADVVVFPYRSGPLKTVQANERLWAVDVSPDGKFVAASTDYTHEVIVWDAVSGKRLKTLDVADTAIGQALFFDQSGKGLWAAGSLDTKLRYFPLE